MKSIKETSLHYNNKFKDDFADIIFFVRALLPTAHAAPNNNNESFTTFLHLFVLKWRQIYVHLYARPHLNPCIFLEMNVPAKCGKKLLTKFMRKD